MRAHDCHFFFSQAALSLENFIGNRNFSNIMQRSSQFKDIQTIRIPLTFACQQHRVFRHSDQMQAGKAVALFGNAGEPQKCFHFADPHFPGHPVDAIFEILGVLVIEQLLSPQA